ncbi:MAG: hypothetical protein S4CHLAM45_07430 [Chlamydiales bacterium]|nr:hypothetical protein [Chlamydiales bacterium]MCH9620240.1 hypothetical protein [Chlamydiales bacterium]MCH9622850.1 hypothetical protein [Chlamydiales bacterium]
MAVANTPLLRHDLSENLLQEHVVSVYKGDFLPDHRNCVRLSMLTVAFLTSLAAKIAFISVSLQLGPVIGEICAACNIIAFTVLEYWAARGIIDQYLKDHTVSQLAMHQQSGESCCRTPLILIGSFIAAVLSQTPQALAASKFNPPHLKVASAVVLLVSSSFLPMRSIQMSCNWWFSRAKGTTEKKLGVIKEELATRLESKADLLQNHISNSSINEDAIIRGLFERAEVHCTADKVRHCTAVVMTWLGRLVTAGVLVATALYMRKQVKEQVYDSDAFGWVAGILATLPNIHLLGDSISSAMVTLTHSLYDTIRRRRSEKLYPALTNSLDLTGAAVNALSLGVVYVIWDKFSSYPIENDVLMGDVILGYYLLMLTATFETNSDIVKTYVLNHGADDERATLNYYYKLNRIAGDIRDSRWSDFALFVSGLPQEIKNPLLQYATLTDEELASYIGDG